MTTTSDPSRTKAGYARLTLVQASLIFTIMLIFVPQPPIRTEAGLRMGLAGGVMNAAMDPGPTFGLAGFMVLAPFRTEVDGGYSSVFVGAAMSLALAACLCIAVRSGDNS